MTDLTSKPTLNALLALDAATCGAMGLLLILGAGPLAGLTALPQGLLTGAGVVLLPICAFMAWAASRRPVPGWATALIVGGNAGWVALSLLLPLAGALAPNALGWAFLLTQGAVVALLAVLEWRAATPRGAVRA